MMNTIKKRTNRTTTQAQPGAAGRTARSTPMLEASDLASRLRGLSLRAYKAVKSRPAGEQPQATSNGELIALRVELARLQELLETQQLRHLVTYVEALRRRIESSLG